MKLGINITLVVLTSMICITGLMLYALSLGHDGVLTTGTIAVLAGIPAWFVTKKVNNKDKNNVW